MTTPEPWLRGPLPGVHPLIAPALYGFQQTREEIDHFTKDLTDQEIWQEPYGLPSVGFQLRHIAGSVERLGTYLAGGQLTPEQLAALREEHNPGAPRTELLATLEAALQAATEMFRNTSPGSLAEPRAVGRKALPTTVIGLLVHIAEHTQRHLGQAITTAHLVRALRKDGQATVSQASRPERKER